METTPTEGAAGVPLPISIIRPEQLPLKLEQQEAFVLKVLRDLVRDDPEWKRLDNIGDRLHRGSGLLDVCLRELKLSFPIPVRVHLLRHLADPEADCCVCQPPTWDKKAFDGNVYGTGFLHEYRRALGYPAPTKSGEALKFERALQRLGLSQEREHYKS